MGLDMYEMMQCGVERFYPLIHCRGEVITLLYPWTVN